MAFEFLNLFWHFFASFDAWHISALHGVNQLALMTAFAYTAFRGEKDNPLPRAFQVGVYVEIVAAACALISLPSLLTGFSMIIAYSLIMRHYFQSRFRKWVENFLSLMIIMFMMSQVDAYLGSAMLLIAFFVFFMLGEKHVRDERKEEEKAKAKKEEKKK
jgi:hypothetical protein